MARQIHRLDAGACERARNRGVRICEACSVSGAVTHAAQRRIAQLEWTDKAGSNGQIAAEIIVLCGGQWSRALGRRLGVTVPLFSCEHFYIVTDVIPGVHRDLPVLRDPDGYIYFKEEVGGLLMGGFEPQATPWLQSAEHRGGIPENFEFQLLRDNWDAFQVLLDNAVIRVPALETAPLKQFYNGPESFTATTTSSSARRRGSTTCMSAAVSIRWELRPRVAPVKRSPNGSSPASRPSIYGRSTSADLRASTATRLAARPDRRGARHALQDAVAKPGTRKRAAVPPLAAVLATAATRRLLRFEDGLGARQLFRAFDSAGAHRVRLGTPELARLGRGRASRVPRSGCGVRYDSFAKLLLQGPDARRAAVARRQRRACHSGFNRLYGMLNSAAATRATSRSPASSRSSS